MNLSSINNDQRLYVMACGAGFSCYGFDVLDRKARAVEWWIESQTDSAAERQAVRLWLDNMPAIGTAEHFAACDSMLKQGAEFSARTGKRCPAELVPALIGLEGRRVECDYFGERIRFYVGKSMGWMPAHLRLKSSRSSGGDALLADHVKSVRAI